MNLLRPSLKEREAVREVLSEGYAQGRIEFVEFKARQHAVDEAETVDALLRAVHGLPSSHLVFAEQPLPRPAENAPKPRVWRRRTVLTAGAALLGFVAAGGVGRVFAHRPTEPEQPRVAETQDVELAPDYLQQPNDLGEALDRLQDAGYTTFLSLMIYPEHLSAQALAPDQHEVVDRVTLRADSLEADPYVQLDPDELLFTLNDVDINLVPTFVDTAPTLLGGQSTTSVRVDMHMDQVSVTASVAGDAYGKGSGSVVWSGDGQQLLRISR